MAVDSSDRVLITGASQGIGRAIAVEVASHSPYPLILTARNAQNLEETARLCRKAGQDMVTVIPCDLSNKDELRNMCTHPEITKVAVLVNNAGNYLQKSVVDSELTDFTSQLQANFLNAVELTRQLLPVLKKKRESRLIFISSVTVQRGQARCGAYSASKQALNGYVQSLREALSSSSVAVTNLIPGQTFSPSWEGADVNPDRLIDPHDIGKTVVWLCGLSGRSCVEEVVIRPQKGDL